MKSNKENLKEILYIEHTDDAEALNKIIKAMSFVADYVSNHTINMFKKAFSDTREEIKEAANEL